MFYLRTARISHLVGMYVGPSNIHSVLWGTHLLTTKISVCQPRMFADQNTIYPYTVERHWNIWRHTRNLGLWTRIINCLENRHIVYRYNYKINTPYLLMIILELPLWVYDWYNVKWFRAKDWPIVCIEIKASWYNILPHSYLSQLLPTAYFKHVPNSMRP